MRPKLLIGLLLVLGFSRALTAYGAQTGTPLTYGQTLSGTITADVPCVYFWFEGAAGDPITIDMTRTSGDLDGVMDLYQQDGANFTQTPLISNDDRPSGGLDPLIEYTLPASDWYTIAACRLQAPQMRATTGTFNLTVTGPAPSVTGSQTVPTTAPPGLSQGLFPSSATQVPTVTPAAPSLSEVLGGSDSTPVLAPGSPVGGELPADTAAINYTLAVQSGDMVVIDWQGVAATFAPLLRVTGTDGSLLAQAATPTSVAALTLAFRAPATDTLTLAVARHGDSIDGTGGSFTLLATLTASAQPATTNAETSTAPPPVTSDSALDNACQIGRDMTFATGSSTQLANVYIAAGDGINPSELTPTGFLTTDDDLNVVFTAQLDTLPALITGAFCAPDGTFVSYDELDVTNNYDERMFGVDWEYYAEPWETGIWWVEIYVNNTFELALSFEVQ